MKKKTQAKDFWDNPQKAQKVSSQLSHLENQTEKWRKIKKDSEDLKLLKGDINDDQLEKEYKKLKQKFEDQKLEIYLDGDYDSKDAFLSLQAGAGGADAQDWTKMLARMYKRFAEKRGWQLETIAETWGEKGGLKKSIYKIKGTKAYGWLKKEQGVHRLIRISPYSSEDQRHTSFALVEITPVLDTPTVEIDPSDLKIDTYRASGPGGQHVNRRETAVRVTHLPTGLKVTSQGERSQAKNKKEALKIIKSRLSTLIEEKQEEKMKNLRSELEPEWGNQIRSYILHPYKQIRDHRTEKKTSNPKEILDGNMEQFIKAELKLN